MSRRGAEKELADAAKDRRKEVSMVRFYIVTCPDCGWSREFERRALGRAKSEEEQRRIVERDELHNHKRRGECDPKK